MKLPPRDVFDCDCGYCGSSDLERELKLIDGRLHYVYRCRKCDKFSRKPDKRELIPTTIDVRQLDRMEPLSHA